MKLRMKGNSIRLRLGQSEVQQLADDGAVEESTAFGPSREQHFLYALRACSEKHGVSANFADGRMVVHVPKNVIHEWAATDLVSIHALQRAGGNDELQILIEKDFKCVDASSGESQEDAFPNPDPGATCPLAKAIERSA
jgi:hypothetical protein